MKILHVLSQMPAKTGSGVYYGNVIDRLKIFGHTQMAVFACQDGSRFDVLEENMQYPVCFKSKALPFPIAGMSDVMPYENTVYSQMDEEKMQAWTKAFAFVLNKANEEFAPDVVILHHLWILTSMGVSIFKNATTIGVCHNTDLRQAMKHPALMEKFVTNIPHLSAIFSLSQAQNKTIAELYNFDPLKIVNIGGGFDENIFYPLPKRQNSKKINIVYAAKIAQSKGIYSLISAFKNAHRINPKLHLDIIGTADEKNASILEKMLYGADNISLYPSMPQKKLAEHLRKQDIFVLPSFFEGIALTAIESLACGLFTVATEIEALMALLGDEVKQSGVIKYVKMPRIYDTDKPCKEDLPDFEKCLENAILLQAHKVEQGQEFPQCIAQKVNSHSWANLAKKIHTEIEKAHLS